MGFNGIELLIMIIILTEAMEAMAHWNDVATCGRPSSEVWSFSKMELGGSALVISDGATFRKWYRQSIGGQTMSNLQKTVF